jgi:ribosomal protein S18 acetylase RimI-like enzyme
MKNVIKTYDIRRYMTSWPSCDNVVISLMDAAYPDTYEPEQIGIVEVRINKTGEHKAEAYIWNLHVKEEYRGKGMGRVLLNDAIWVAEENGCKAVTLDWSIEEAPQWVFDWYYRNGFDERKFGRGCAFMEKKLKGGEA